MKDSKKNNVGPPPQKTHTHTQITQPFPQPSLSSQENPKLNTKAYMVDVFLYQMYRSVEISCTVQLRTKN